MKTQAARLAIRAAQFMNRLTTNFHCKLTAASLRSCGKKLDIKPRQTVILGPENIDIGTSFSSLGSLFLYGNEGELKIGDYCSFKTNVVIGSSGSKISIGNNVLIAPNVVIRAADHIYKDPKILIRCQGHQGDAITIEDDVWICSNCVITKGVTIGQGSVVAAGSVVTRSIPPYSVAGGVPAKTIRHRG